MPPSFLYRDMGRIRQRCSLRIEVDVVGHEEIEMAVAVVVDESASGVPAALAVAAFCGDSGFAATSVNVPLPLLCHRHSRPNR